MDEEFLKQVHAEMLAATGQAISLLTIAIAQQVDAAKLAAALRRAIDVPPHQSDIGEPALKMIRQAIEGADEVARQLKPRMH